MSKEAWLMNPLLCLIGLGLFFWVPCGWSMEVTAPANIQAMNGTNSRLSCTFTSCYKVNNKKFSMNWTYRECDNCTEQMFITFQQKIINLKLERFRDRMEFTGNPNVNDLSVTLRDVKLDDQGIYTCYVLNPPDRYSDHKKIKLQVITEAPPERDSTVAVIVGASVGGFLAIIILVLMIVKCIRRKKQKNAEDQKTEEEGKTDGEGSPEEGAKLP
ncbi:sodium channel regulatory subunit beta-2 isoform X1 [Microcaecilia unicolor]|uniref:Sodium channel subunit beta-2 isoform X1 n=2 Tax=Microcaecilia unicolor TaxID=1415580 RepID=A0A6P7ZLB8_9AMPH|nr:sodium channel subunit beta-2 isoform X1 [Microcaecilia unicolor]